MLAFSQTSKRSKNDGADPKMLDLPHSIFFDPVCMVNTHIVQTPRIQFVTQAVYYKSLMTPDDIWIIFLDNTKPLQRLTN